MFVSNVSASSDKNISVIFAIVAIFYQNVFLRSPVREILVVKPSPLFSHHRNFLRKFNAALAGR
jgi:hypothetical protein